MADRERPQDEGRERGEGRGFGRPGRRDFDRDRPRRDFDRDRPRRDFDRDRPRREFDPGRPRRDFDPDRPRRQFDRPRRDFDRRPPGRGPVRPSFVADRRPPPPRTDLVGDDEELVAGRRPVAEAFAARRDARRLLVVPERRAALESIVLHATTLRLQIVEVEGGTLTSLCGFDGHQGVALVVAQREPIGIDEMLERARSRGEEPFVLVLDSLEDPQNLGTLLRSAEACGVHGVVYPTRHAAPLTAAAIKASAGASEHLLLAPVDSLPGTLADLRSAGLRLVGADEGAALRYSEADLRGPLALVVGSEERGISGALRRRLDMSVRIPMRGRVASLNAAVAGSVLLFAAAEQRGTPEADEMTAGEQPLAEGKPQGEPEPDGKPEGEAEAPAKRAPRRRKPSSTSAADPGETGEADLLPGEPEGSQPA